MLAAIDFNDQFSLETYEVQDVLPEGDLSAKLDIVEPSITQQQPKLLFGIGGDTPHRTRMFA